MKWFSAPEKAAVLLLLVACTACNASGDDDSGEDVSASGGEGVGPSAEGDASGGSAESSGGDTSGPATGGSAAAQEGECLSDELVLPEPVTVELSRESQPEPTAGELPTEGRYELVKWVVYGDEDDLPSDERNRIQSSVYRFYPDDTVAVAYSNGYRVTFERMDLNGGYLVLLGICPGARSEQYPDRSAYQIVRPYSVEGDRLMIFNEENVYTYEKRSE